jgi:hypothetical protein
MEIVKTSRELAKKFTDKFQFFATARNLFKRLLWLAYAANTKSPASSSR